MKKIKVNRIIQIVYPLLVYYLIYNLCAGIFQYVFDERYGKLVSLLFAGIITTIPIFSIYLRVPHLIPKKDKNFKEILTFIAYIIITIVVGIMFNILISKSGIVSNSNTFSEAQNTLADGSLIIKVLSNAIVIPVLEEILYRGIILGQLSYMVDYKLAIIISSFCFGILHFNIVQFLYAFIMGLIIGMFHYKSKSLFVSIISHASLNLLVILFT